MEIKASENSHRNGRAPMCHSKRTCNRAIYTSDDPQNTNINLMRGSNADQNNVLLLQAHQGAKKNKTQLSVSSDDGAEVRSRDTLTGFGDGGVGFEWKKKKIYRHVTKNGISGGMAKKAN